MSKTIIVAGTYAWEEKLLKATTPVEIISPFSDPAAESPDTQRAFEEALNRGYRLGNLFESIEKMRPQITNPITLRIYANPIVRYGKDAFMARLAALGIGQVIIQDAPRAERGEFETEALRHGVEIV